MYYSGERPIVDLHIEKTGGTSRKRVWAERFGSNRVLEYSEAADRLTRMSDKRVNSSQPLVGCIRYLVRRSESPLASVVMKAGQSLKARMEAGKNFGIDELTADYAAIIGHMAGSRMAEHVPPEEARYVSALRDPLERARSHYEHWREHWRHLSAFGDMVPVPEGDDDDSVTFEEFALRPEMQNYQTRRIGIDPERMHLLGLTARLPEFFEELGVDLGSAGMPHINRAPNGAARNTDYDPGFVAAFIESNAEDYELYERACVQYDAQDLLPR